MLVSARHTLCPSVLASSRRLLSNLNRPSPPPLPREQQRQFEKLQRAVQTPPAKVKSSTAEANTKPSDTTKPEFEGDINPVTGECGGPKREPVGRWGNDSDGDWSFKGRVSDF